MVWAAANNSGYFLSIGEVLINKGRGVLDSTMLALYTIKEMLLGGIESLSYYLNVQI